MQAECEFETARYRKTRSACLLNLLLTIFVGGVVFITVPWMVQVVRIHGDSMAPTVSGGQLLLVNRLAYRLQPLKHGDIIVFNSPTEDNVILVKRVIALPGESVVIRDGVVYVDGQRLYEPYVVEPDTSRFGPLVVEPGTVFVLGDHRTVSNDSRAWGLLPQANILGRAEFSVWPSKPLS